MLYYKISEIAFRSWFANFVTTAVANATPLGLNPAQTTALTAAQTTYATGVNAYTAAHDAAKSATTTKNIGYDAAFALVQLYANQWQENPAITDALKLSLGLQIRDTGPSPRPIFAVTDLTASGNAVGTVRLRWDRNGNLPGCNFILQTRPAGATEWTFATVTQRAHIAVGGWPIAPTEIRVLTERRGIISEPSESTLVYGEVSAPAGPATLHLLEAA